MTVSIKPSVSNIYATVLGVKHSKFKDRDVHISYFSIFRYATWLEITATIVGVLLGLLSGGGVVVIIAHLGDLINSFVERTSQQDRLSSFLPLTQFYGGGLRLVNASDEENMAALVEDAKATVIGVSTTIGTCLVVSTLSVTLTGWSAWRQVTRIRVKFFRAVLRQDMSWFDTNNEFNFATKMTENLMQLKEGMGEKLTIISNLVGTSIIGIIASMTLGWELTLACVSVMPFSLLVSYKVTNYQTKSTVRELKAYSQAGKLVEEVLKSIRTVVAFSGEQKEADRYKKLLEPAQNYGSRRGLYTGLGNGFVWISTYAINSIGYAYGARLVLNDSYKDDGDKQYLIRNLLTIILTTYRATQAIAMCIPHVDVLASARSAATTVFEIIEQQPHIDSLSTTGSSPRRIRGEISFENVHFSYPSRPETKILKDFSMHVKPGECVAIVGSSGSGKSTILHLLQRLYDVTSGTIKLDGKNIKELNINWLRSSLGIVGQEPVLFRGSIHENIAIACPEATRDDVQCAAEEASVHDFIKTLPNGYETQVGEFGAGMSGGQRQRVALARAVAHSPAILLLDEPTAALDAHHERLVQAALDHAARGRTTVTVSHRLSTIVNADRIICMDQGVIVEQGTHDELMKIKGFYYKLITTKNNEESSDTKVRDILSDKTDNDANALLLQEKSELQKTSMNINERHNRKELREFLPRASVPSIMPIDPENISCNTEADLEDEEIKEVKPISNLELLKLNAPEWVSVTIGTIASIINGVCFPGFAIVFGYANGIFSIEDHEQLLRQADMYAWLFLAIAVIAGIAMSVQSYTFTSSGSKMVNRLRYQYFSALMQQDPSDS